MKSIVITGASTGIGFAAARELLTHGYRVFGSVRRQVDADRLRDELPAEFTPLLFDVTDHDAVRRAADLVGRIVGDAGVAGLVNNAGIGVSGPWMHLSLEDVRRQFEVNFFGTVAVTKEFLPLLGAKRDCPHAPGRVVNISSGGGQIATPFGGPYAASKHALEALSDSLRRELLPYGIDVVIVAPGAVRTPIWDKPDQTEIDRFASTDYAVSFRRHMAQLHAHARDESLPAEVVGRAIRESLENTKPSTRRTVMARIVKNWLVPRYLLPSRWLDRAIGQQLFDIDGGQAGEPHAEDV